MVILKSAGVAIPHNILLALDVEELSQGAQPTGLQTEADFTQFSAKGASLRLE